MLKVQVETIITMVNDMNSLIIFAHLIHKISSQRFKKV